jgi:hypothetical protein
MPPKACIGVTQNVLRLGGDKTIPDGAISKSTGQVRGSRFFPIQKVLQVRHGGMIPRALIEARYDVCYKMIERNVV